jgi:UDP-glucose 4-epimerase
LIPIALRQIALGNPVVRLGDGSMVRDFVYVEDLVHMITPIVGAQTEFRLYNVGSGIGYSVNDILDSLRRVTGIEFAVEQRPVPPTFVDRVVLNTSRYQREFGTAPLTTLDSGVASTYEEIRKQVGE